ncbi:MAG: alpha-L-arabinofuranosidase C-terminal domain-containing protein [Bacteroidota bacterium]
MVAIISALVLATNYAAGLTISGTVTTTAQQALAGTDLTVFYAKPLKGASVKLFAANDKALANPIATATAADNGRYSLDVPAPNANYIIVAEMSKYYPRILTLPVKAASVAPYDIWLEAEDTGNVTISIDPAVTKPVQMRIGYNNQTMAISYRYNEANFTAAMKESGATLMRFPAGTYGNFYDFSTDDFIDWSLKQPASYYIPSIPNTYATPEAYRTAYENTLKNFQKALDGWLNTIEGLRKRRGKYGYEDFLELTKNMNADAVYMGNISTAPDGKDPVDYFVGTMRYLKDKGKSIKYLELGNELACYANQNRFNGFYDRPRVLSESERAGTAIREIFPEAKIAVFGAWSGTLAVADGLNRDAFNNLWFVYPNKSFYDAVTMHPYLQIKALTGDDPQLILDKMMAATQLMPLRAAKLWRSTFPGKEIWLTESGYVTDGPGGASYLATGILYTITEMNYILNWLAHDDIIRMYIKHTALTELLNDNTVLFYKDMAKSPELIKTPSYYGFSMIGGAIANSAQHLGITVKNDQVYLARPLMSGNFDATDPVQISELTARALLGKDGRTIFVPFVNSSQRAKKVALELTGASLEGRTVEVRYIAGQLTDRNTREEPDKVKPVTLKLAADGVFELPAYSTGVIKLY